MNTTITTTNRTPGLSHKALCNAIDIGFGEGWSAAYRTLKCLAQNDNIPPAISHAVTLATAILSCHETDMINGFDPEDCIDWDYDGGNEEK